MVQEIREQFASEIGRKPTKDEIVAAVTAAVSQRTGIGKKQSKIVETLMKLFMRGMDG